MNDIIRKLTSRKFLLALVGVVSGLALAFGVEGSEINQMVKGVMVESYIEPGSQKIGEHCYGKSITDPCLGWEKSERLIYEIAEQY